MSCWVLLQQSELRHASLCAYEDFAVHDKRCDEFISRTKVVARARLIAVVQLFRQIRGIVGMQYCGVAVLDRPHNTVRSPVGRDCRRGSRIPERSGTLGAG